MGGGGDPCPGRRGDVGHRRGPGERDRGHLLRLGRGARGRRRGDGRGGRDRHPGLRGAAIAAASVVRPPVRPRRQPGQHPPGGRPGPGDAPALAARGHLCRPPGQSRRVPNVSEPAGSQERPGGERGGTVNLVPARYRSVSVASVPVPLDEASLRAHLVGRPAYRHTRYIVARQAGGTAVVEVAKRSSAPLFSEITAVTMVARPDETAFVDAPEADTGVPTALGRIAADRAPGARCVVVRGRYGHVGFIVDPAPVRIRVVEVVPPLPAKLLDQASRVLELAEDLPPVELAPELTDLGALASSSPAGHYLFPCRAGGAAAGVAGADGTAAGGARAATGRTATGGAATGGAATGGAATGRAAMRPVGAGPAADAMVSYLDEIPPRADWTLVGCARSRAIHDWFYDGPVAFVDMCPRQLARQAAAGGTLPVLTKCCLLEDKVVAEDG